MPAPVSPNARSNIPFSKIEQGLWTEISFLALTIVRTHVAQRLAPLWKRPPSQLLSSRPLGASREMRSHQARRKLVATPPTTFHPRTRRAATPNFRTPPSPVRIAGGCRQVHVIECNFPPIFSNGIIVSRLNLTSGAREHQGLIRTRNTGFFGNPQP